MVAPTLMPNTCILTDYTAQIPHPTFTGHYRVKVIPYTSNTNKPPSVESIIEHYATLSRSFDSIIVITSASSLGPVAQIAAQAATLHGGRTSINVIDSQNLGIGLGIMVQHAAEYAEAGKSSHEIERLVRSMIPNIYSIYCIPNLDGLARSGYLSPAQSTVSTILGVMPIFALEAGHMVPYHKVRTTRHLLESFQEFVGEYETPRQIALIKGRDVRLRMRPLRQFIEANFPKTSFTEHVLNPALISLFGDDTVGLVVLD